MFFYGLLTILPFIGDYGESFSAAILGERMTLWATVGSAAILARVIWAGSSHRK